MPNEYPLRILVITSRPLTDGAGNPIVLLDVEEERRRLRVALDLSPSASPERRGERAAFARFLPEATTGAIIDALADEWDVVHFTGMVRAMRACCSKMNLAWGSWSAHKN